MTQKKIRFGVLGCSRIAKKSALPALIDSECAELAIIGSRSPEHAQEYAKTFNCTAGSYGDVLKSNIDAIYISLPNSLHEEWARKAAQAGKHVWCEKPAALSYASAKKMVEAARKNNVRLMEGFMFLWHPQHAKVQALIQEGSIGKILGLEGRFSFPMPDSGNIRLNAELGGGIYNDAGVYSIRASRMIFGEEPLDINCRLSIDPQTNVDVKAEMELSYPDAKTAHLSSAFDTNYVSTYKVIGTKGHISMERAYAVPKDMPVKIFVTSDGEKRDITIPPADHFRLMIDEFCKEIALGTKSTKKYEEELLAQARVLDAGRLSHAEKRVANL